MTSPSNLSISHIISPPPFTKWNVLDIIIIPTIEKKNSFISCKVFNHFKGRGLKSETRHKIKTRQRKMCQQQSDERKLFQSHGIYNMLKKSVSTCVFFRPSGVSETMEMILTKLSDEARWRERITEERANELTLCQRSLYVSHHRFILLIRSS
jgi:hypothetical protein